MSAPTADLYSLSSLALALFAALAGSLHCVGMCGPLRLLTGLSWRAGAQYQGGRLFAYLLLGALAGAAGLALPLSAVLGVLVIALVLTLAPIPLPAFLSAARARALRLASAHPALLGFASGLLPCGLLHGWVAAAAVLGGPIPGAALLFTLWLGTLPALEAGGRALRRPIEAARRRFPRGLPVALLLLALLPISMRLGWPLPIHSHGKAAHCHDSSSAR